MGAQGDSLIHSLTELFLTACYVQGVTPCRAQNNLMQVLPLRILEYGRTLLLPSGLGCVLKDPEERSVASITAEEGLKEGPVMGEIFFFFF